MVSSTERNKVLDNESKIYCTNISTYNPYYVSHYGRTPDGQAGYGTAITISKDARKGMWKNNSTYGSQLGARLDDGTPVILPNCVGFVNGRSYEIWNMALKSGYLVKEGDVYKIPSKDKTIPKFRGVPACNAYSFKDSAFYAGGYEGYYKSSSPVPGAIVCWRNDYASDGQPGHVGFVEAVFNQGTDDEYCITSESGYCGDGVKYVVWTRRLYKNPSHSRFGSYGCGVGPLAWFLCSPICELASTGGAGQSITVDDVYHLTDEEIAAINALREQYSGKHILKDIKVGAFVEIQWLGNTKPDGKGKRINKMGTEDGYVAQIIKKDLTQPYPYGLSSDGETVFGYYQRTGIKPLNKEDETSEGWIV